MLSVAFGLRLVEQKRVQSSISPTRDATASLCRMLLADLGSVPSTASSVTIAVTAVDILPEASEESTLHRYS